MLGFFLCALGSGVICPRPIILAAVPHFVFSVAYSLHLIGGEPSDCTDAGLGGRKKSADATSGVRACCCSRSDCLGLYWPAKNLDYEDRRKASRLLGASSKTADKD